MDSKRIAHIPGAVFSILIPSWNNLKYLQLCIRGIREHSTFPHQIIVIINEGTDGTADWVTSQTDLSYIYSPTNLGICVGLNEGAKLAETNYLTYMNDDMFPLPGWDAVLFEEIQRVGHPKFFLSSTMIEPFDTGNACVIVNNTGDSYDTFNEAELLKQLVSFHHEDWYGATWPPNVIHKSMWEKVGGMSVEFSPGMYSDPDLSMKLWKSGVRYYKGMGKSLVYHFGTKSTGRIKQNKGKKTFIKKWSMSPRDFYTHYLKMGQPFRGPLPEMKQGILFRIKSKIKRLFV